MFALGPSDSNAETIDRPLKERVVSAAGVAMAYWYYRWDWGESIAYDGLDAAAKTFDLPFLADFVTYTVNNWLESSDTRPISRHGPGRCVLTRYEVSGEDRFLSFARKLGDHVLSLPQHSKGPFLLDPGREFVAVDSHYGEPAFLLELAQVTGNERYAERGVALALNHTRALQNNKLGIYRHFVDLASGESPECHWGRGNGWAALGISDVLVRADPSIDGVSELQQRFLEFCESLARYEVPGGGWRNLIDLPTSYPESSATALIAAGMTQAVRAKILPGRFETVADRGWSKVAHRIDTYGSLVGVSYRPGINTDLSRYEHTPTIGAFPWGQGAYLIAAAQRMSLPSDD